MSQEPTDSDAAQAGQTLSQWLPYGAVRKVLFFVALGFGGVGLLIGTASWYHYALIVWAMTMSPRLIGELAYFLGRMSAK